MVHIIGTPGNDVINGTSDPDWLEGRGGADRLFGRGGNDTLDGGPGNDPVLEGGAGDDLIRGFAGNDRLIGGAGEDHLNGGTGRDTLDGGTGDDNFDFNSTNDSNGSNRDRILNFTFGGANTGDKIDVATIDAIAGGANDDFTFVGTTPGGAGELWAANAPNGDTWILGNVDGDATAEFQVAVADGATDASFWFSIDFILA